MKTGQAVFSFGAEEIKAYAALSGDWNPIHIETDAAKAAGFSAPVVHGMLAAGKMLQLLAEHFGVKAELAKTQFSFVRAVCAGDRVRVEFRETAEGWTVEAYVEDELSIRGKVRR